MYIFHTALEENIFLVNFNFGASQVFDHIQGFLGGGGHHSQKDKLLLGVRKTLGSWDRLYEERKVVSLGALENDYAHPTNKP